SAVTELESIAADFQRPLFEAGALTGRGELLLGEDRPSEASPILGRSWRLWQETDLPYESARARLHYAEALSAEGDQTSARRELRSAFAHHRGEEVNSTGDGFFVAFERALDGLDCAVDIQRRLARHRREHGFAPRVRIGLHTAEATREGRDYRGRGVHVAARI